MGAEDILKIADNARKEALASAKGRFQKSHAVGNGEIEDADFVELSQENAGDGSVSMDSVVTHNSVANAMFETGETTAPADNHEPAIVVSEQVEPIEVIVMPEVETANNEAVAAIESIKVEAARVEDSRENELLAALDEARNSFANTEYRDRTAMQRIRKALNMSAEGDKEHPNIESARKPYQDALRQHMEYQVDKLKDGGIQGKELEGKVKELYSFFNLQEATKYYDARTQAKMDYLAETENKNFAKKTWDFARLKSTQVSEWYSKKVPTSVKLGLAAATFIPGASAFALGKRTWGALMMVAAGGMQLDKIAQLKDLVADKLERNNEFKNISAENGNVDFDKLKELLGGKIDNIDRKLSEKNLRSGANKFIAFAGAVFLGASVFKGAMDFAEGKEVASTKLLGKLFASKVEAPVGGVANIDGVSKMESLGTSTGKTLDLDPKEFSVLNGHNVVMPASVTPLTDSLEHHGSAPAGAADHLAATKEALNEHAPSESLKIEKGSSIEKTLIDHIKKVHPGMKNPGMAAHRMWLDYMHDNKADIIKKVGEGEYGKMLKDGMVNVKPGTTLILDEHDPLRLKLHDIGGKISHLNPVHHAPSGKLPYDVLKPDEIPAEAKVPNVPTGQTAQEIAEKVVAEHKQGEILATQQEITSAQERFAHFNAEYDHIVSDPAGYQDGSPTIEQGHAMFVADEARKAAAGDVERLTHAKDIFLTDIKNSTMDIYKSTGYKWEDIKDIEFRYASGDEKLKPIISQMENLYKKEFGVKFNPRYGETFGRWLYRLKQVAIKKRLHIDIE